jgi:hypothetical protein
MMIDVLQPKKEIDKNGFVKISSFLTKKKCKETIKKLDFIQSERIKKSEFIGNIENQVLYNYFIECPELLEFVYNKNIFNLMCHLLDKDHVLTTSSARNKRKIKNYKSSRKASGIGWHTDGRYVLGDKIPIKPSFSYIVIYMLEDFNKNNGATEYVPNSHKFNFRPERNGDYKKKYFYGSQGDIIIMDTALFHKAGISSYKSRWSIFSMYSSWYIKPYFQFDKIFTKKQFKDMNPKLRQLFHQDSIPPKNQNINRATLRRVQEIE